MLPIRGPSPGRILRTVMVDPSFSLESGSDIYSIVIQQILGELDADTRLDRQLDGPVHDGVSEFLDFQAKW